MNEIERLLKADQAMAQHKARWGFSSIDCHDWDCPTCNEYEEALRAVAEARLSASPALPEHLSREVRAHMEQVG